LIKSARRILFSIYVVGETRGLLDGIYEKYLSKDKSGRISKHAFLIKLNAETLDKVWARQLGGVSGKDVIAYGCAVSPNDEVVYMAGTVADGDKIRYETRSTESAGGDDIFVANYDSSNGKNNYVKQTGSSKDDWLAKGNGIVADKEGNAILLGNSKGSMMRWREDQDENLAPIHGLSSDIFVLSVERLHGSMKTVSERVGKTKERPEPISQDQDEEMYELLGTEVLTMVLGATVAVFTSLYVGYKALMKSTSDERANDRTMQYLEDFDDPNYELHVRTSATSGIHAIYGEKIDITHILPNISKPLINFDTDITDPMDKTTSRRHAGLDTGTPPKRKSSTISSIDSDIAEIMEESEQHQLFLSRNTGPPRRAFSGNAFFEESNISLEPSARDDDSSTSFENIII